MSILGWWAEQSVAPGTVASMQGSLLNYCHHSYFSHPPTWKGLSQPPGKMSSALARAFSPSPRQHPIILRTPYLSLSFSVFTQQEPFHPSPALAPRPRGRVPAAPRSLRPVGQGRRLDGASTWLQWLSSVRAPQERCPGSPDLRSLELSRPLGYC